MGEQQWREILIDVEPRGKEFRLGIDQDSLVSNILEVVIKQCQDEGVDIKQWATKQVGADYQFVLLRKAEGNAILSPGVLLGDVRPEIQNGERFKLGTQPVVGAGLPVNILNRRLDMLIDEFYRVSIGEIYQKEGWTLIPAKKKMTAGNIHNL